MTDKQILKLINDDTTREKGYRTLMSLYQEMLYQHIRRITNNHEDTNDVLQNTFIKVFRNIDKFRMESGLYTWIYRIATNEALSLLKKNKRKYNFIDSEMENNGLEDLKSPVEAPDAEKIRDQLRRAMEKLPAKQKIVFSLRYFEEMSYKKMSEVLGTSESSLKASYHHAVKKIELFFNTAKVF